MKKIWKYTMLLAAAVALMPLAACSDNDDLDKSVAPYATQFAYFYQPYQDYSSIEYKYDGAFLSQLEDPIELTTVKLTKPADGNVVVTVGVDPALVDEYNAANGTDYKLLTGAVVLNPEQIIESGKYQSEEKITISLADHSCLENSTEDFVLPISITAVSGGVTISKSSRTFLVFKYKANAVSLINKTLEVGNDQSTWASQLQDVTFANFAMSGWPADEPIEIEIEVDNSLIAGYNAANGTNFVAMTGATLKSDKLTILAGEYTADLSLDITDYSEISTGYVIPVRLKSVVTPGSSIDEENSVAYIVICTKLPKVTVVQGFNVAALTPADNWNITVDGADSFEEDGETYYWKDLYTGYLGTYVNEDQVMVFDLGEAHTLNGFSLTFYEWYYGISSLKKVETSVNGTDYKNWGGVDFFFYGDTPGFEFSLPVSARYVRIILGGPSYGADWGTFITGVNMYGE